MKNLRIIVFIFCISIIYSCNNKGKSEVNLDNTENLADEPLTESLQTINKDIDKNVVSDINNFVSGKWEIADTYYGDLNKDGEDDVVIIAEENDPNNIIIQPEYSLGADTLYTSPRMLLVAFKEGNNYRLIAKNEHFLPPSNDIDQACLEDPLSEPGGISISKGVLTIKMHYWYSCGSWYVSDNTYVFRYQNEKMQLIGFSSSSFHRASGEMTSMSINYSTKKMQTTTGGNMFEGESDKPKEKWENIEVNRLYDLEEMTDELQLY